MHPGEPKLVNDGLLHGGRLADGPNESETAVSSSSTAGTGTPTKLQGTVVVKMSFPSCAQQQHEMESSVACSGQFGVTNLLLCFQAVFASGRPVSNAIFLPTPAEGIPWPLFTQSDSRPDTRPLIVLVTEEIGTSLTHCKDAWDLCLCMLHALLGASLSCHCSSSFLILFLRRLVSCVWKRHSPS